MPRNRQNRPRNAARPTRCPATGQSALNAIRKRHQDNKNRYFRNVRDKSGLGRYAEAEPLYERLLAVEEKALGPEHPDLDESLTNYAALLQTMGRDAEAARMEARAKAIRNPISPPGRARRAT